MLSKMVACRYVEGIKYVTERSTNDCSAPQKTSRVWVQSTGKRSIVEREARKDE
jgi:hypothetical protein